MSVHSVLWFLVGMLLSRLLAHLAASAAVRCIERGEPACLPERPAAPIPGQDDQDVFSFDLLLPHVRVPAVAPTPEPLPSGCAILESRVDLAESECGVCGDRVGADVITCGACEAPHHAECWSYNRGCSTYACGEQIGFETR